MIRMVHLRVSVARRIVKMEERMGRFGNRRQIVICLLLVQSSLAPPVQAHNTQTAESPELQQMLEAYKSNRIEQTLTTAKSILASDPKNATALYYMANCHLKLGHSSEAKACYQDCLRASPADSELGQFARKALEGLSRLEQAPGRGASANQTPTEEPRTLNTPRIAVQTEERKVAALTAQIETLRRRKQDAQAQISRINSDFEQAMAEIPKTIWVWSSSGKRIKEIDNPDYKSNYSALHSIADKKIDCINKDIATLEKQMTDAGLATTVSLDQANNNLQSQLNTSAAGTVRLTPQGTDLYVRNYINFSGQPEFHAPPMRQLPTIQERAGTKSQERKQ